MHNQIKLMLACMTKAIPYLSETKQWGLLSRAYNIMAITSVNRGNAPVAVDYYLDALECAKEHNLRLDECRIHINLGYLYMQNGVYQEANEQFVAAYDIYQKSPDREKQLGRLIMIYTNFASCYLLQGKIDRAGEYVRSLNEQCKSYFNDMDYVYVGCMEARYYNCCGKTEERDKIIQGIMDSLENPDKFDGPLPILDLFDDLYSLCELAFEIGKYDICAQIAGKLDPVIENTDIINLERKLLALKIQYYKSQNDMEKYKNASMRFYELVMTMEEESKHMIANMIRIRNALEQVKKQNALLLKKSETDALTGLANRYRLTDYSQHLMDECLREQVPYAIEILDIDYFKEYNDNYGHQAGDTCIMQVANLLNKMQSKEIFCARYGGDEFIVIYKGLSRNEILSKAMKLKNDIAGLQLKHEYSRNASIVTISQGICITVPTESNRSWDFLHQADNYLYQVKREGRNAICIGDAKEMELVI
ncbi:MAG: diguanylate cyclase [Roseburia sp.]|uniref:tetratricopeptide repeat-containing diguanylate cyclase n=1 Tax=Roseburia sp. 831b TaxID=1261635 RepID=UPI0009529678|nr:diguanylate cyclase [Roseburia sp. 831b]MCI5919199.1 diguanylate cyclase [Roseburia sp.]WVK74527.1 tetratricopeptide repeat-containing diguanylate cyclase [Roseburia sp. 831b]